MKIAVLGTRGFPDIQGGVETHCENLYPRLVKKGCEVTVFTRRPYANLFSDSYKGVRLVALSCPKNKFFEAFFHTFYGVFVAKRIRPDIVHIHAVGPSLFIPLARLMGLKAVMTNHGPDYQRKKWPKPAKAILKLGEYLGTRWANSVICISKPIADYINKKYNRRVTVIPNGVVIPEVSKGGETLKKYALEKGRYILAVGRLVPEKGFDDLIEAFKIIQGQSPTGTVPNLVIVGRADHKDKYSLDLKKKAEGDKNIILTGFLTGEPLRELYSQAGLFVLPSYYEGLPIVLLEAMSYGLSCIASDIAANRDLGLSEDRFFKAGDVGAFAEKIKEFISKPFSEEEKKKQIDFIADKYDWEKIADRTLEVYRAV